MAQPNLRSTGTALNLIAGGGQRTAPATLIASGTIATTLPAPTMAAVPSGAIAAEFQFTYSGAAGTSGGVGAFVPYVGDGTHVYQPFAPYGYGLVDGPETAAGATSYYLSARVPVDGWAYAGVAAKEDGDTGHAGTLTVQVVWIS